MLQAYFSDRPAERSTTLPAGSKPANLVWVDLLKASASEISSTETVLGIKVPSLASLSEVEHSSRMRWEGDAIVLSLPLPAAATGGNTLMPVGFVLRDDVLVTVRFDAEKQFDDFSDAFQNGTPADRSAASILTGLFEVIVDAMADRLEETGAKLDEFAAQIFRAESPPGGGHRSPKLKSATLRELLRRVGSLGQLLGKLRASLLTAGRIVPFVETEAKDWLEEGAASRLATVKADIASLDEYLTHLSDKVQFLLDAALGLINMDQNDSFKVLTIVSVVGIPPTLIASMYGMNFHYMPELSWAWGYPYGLALIALSAVVPLVWFKAKGWF